MTKIIYFVLIAFVVSSCYHVQYAVSGTVDSLESTPTRPPKCSGPYVIAKSTAIQSYYGAPSIDKTKLV